MKKYSEDFGKQKEAILQKMKMSRDKPVISVTSKELPPIEEWEIGKTYTVYGKVELKSLRKTDTGVSGELEIIELTDEDSSEDDSTD